MDYNTLARHVATQFKKYREKAGLTQAEVAQKAGVTVETCARLERVLRGRRSANANPSLETLARLAYAIGIEPMAFFRDVIKVPDADDGLAGVLMYASPSVRELLAVLGKALIAREHRIIAAAREADNRPKPAKKKHRQR